MSSSSGPRGDGPSCRRRFTPAQKLESLAAYERACEQGQGGAYLHREGLYSSLVSEWRRLQVYARLLTAGTYLCSVSTMYRVLTANAQVKERRRLARHPARVAPELVATGPGQVCTWDI